LPDGFWKIASQWMFDFSSWIVSSGAKSEYALSSFWPFGRTLILAPSGLSEKEPFRNFLFFGSVIRFRFLWALKSFATWMAFENFFVEGLNVLFDDSTTFREVVIL